MRVGSSTAIPFVKEIQCWITSADAPTLIILKLIYTIYFVYDAAICIARASALLFYNRVFTRRANTAAFNAILWALHALNITWFIGIVFGTIFLCKPINKNWDPALPGTCGPTRALWIGSAVPSVSIDLIILILPLPKIWHLRETSFKRKVGLIVVFILGYCVVIVSLGRLISILISGDALNIDITYEGMPVVYWITAEAPILLLGICVPAMLPLSRHLTAHYFVPLMSKSSSVLKTFSSSGSSKIRSTNGSFSQGTSASHKLYLQAGNTGTLASSAEDIEMSSDHSMSSQREIFRTARKQEEYSAACEAGNSRPEKG
ncbi:conserved hypothetical protein [Talaromyces stipitatus ATCC 10500]|uniref:Rhodopsin domain-containing protein n=1 Tax=Talaromyces stipitatus (strain ATCC 10500 / CBS 375.48 / QM 6759 / NRRL 1006) TaxID=441959 RepID=B8MSG1_TALSN|nr:uncharacterized protein TSTA_000340 [Talaromyces stipitatus ATCC 10500]EED11956.1 conserved hypothetical protein [Talaromyces stipitatus ATCC 10500]